MPVPKGRGKRLRVRRKKIPGHPNKYLEIDVMQKPGPRGGHTVAHVKKKKKKK